jgi:2'-5' RNA ligase
MPRLFTAIELSPDAREAVLDRQRKASAAPRDRSRPVRPTPAGQVHLTVVFIGEVDDSRAAAIAESMRAPLAADRFEIAFDGFGVFPPRGPARVLWIGVGSGASAMVDLFSRVMRRLETVGVPREQRPYVPHLTIGRWRDGEGPRHLELPAFGPPVVDHVAGVTLFESRLRPSGAEHVALLRCPLGEDAALNYTEKR